MSDMRSVNPFSVAFWYCTQWDLSSLQWEVRLGKWAAAGPVARSSYGLDGTSL